MRCSQCKSERVEYKTIKNRQTKMYEGQWECPDCGPTMPEPNKTSKEEIEYAVTVEKNMNDQYQKWVDDMSRALGVECPVLPKGAKPLDLEDWFKKPGGGK